MVGWPGAAQDLLPAHALDFWPGCPDVPRGPGEERRGAGAPARERGAAPERGAGAVRASRPGLVHRAHAVHPAAALDRGLSGDARDAAGLAPQARRQEVRHEQPAPARPPGDGPQHRPACRPPGEGEPALGIPACSWRADQAGRDGRAVDCARDPALVGYRSGTAPGWPDVAAVPARAGRRDPGRRFFSRRYRAAEQAVCAGIRRARHSPDAPVRRHRPPGR